MPDTRTNHSCTHLASAQPPIAPFSKAIVLGSGRIACDCIQELASTGLPVLAIQNDNSAFSLLRRAANRPNCSWQEITDHGSLNDFFLNIRQSTLVVSANNAWIIPPDVLANPALRFINYHNSLLPRHRGRNAPTWAIFSGDQNAGATWHLLDSGIDTGPILAQTPVPVSPHTTALQLVAHCMQAAAELFRQFLPNILRWSLNLTHQSRALTEYHSSREVPADGLLDPNWTFPQISRLLRALDYGPLDILPKPRLLEQHLSPGQCPVIARYSIRSSSQPQPAADLAGCITRVISRPDADIVLWLRPAPAEQSSNRLR